MKNKLLLAALALLVVATTAFAQKNDWKLKKEVDDLKVYFRKGETSGIKEVKVQFEVQASLRTIVATLKDVPAFTDWVYSCTEAELIKRVSDTESIYYSRIAFPFPMSDRDFIAKSRLTQNPNTKEIFVTVTGDYDYLPQKKDVVRMPKLIIKWHIQPVSAHKAIVNYHLVSNPGGSIPEWAVNMAIDKGPTYSMKNFREMLKKPKYQQAQLAYIQEWSGQTASDTR